MVDVPLYIGVAGDTKRRSREGNKGSWTEETGRVLGPMYVWTGLYTCAPLGPAGSAREEPKSAIEVSYPPKMAKIFPV